MNLTDREIDELIDDWEPDALAPADTKFNAAADSPLIITEMDGVRVKLDDDRWVIDTTTENFLGYAGNAAIKEQAIETLDEFTCGSCGPRGFYGTTRKHLEVKLPRPVLSLFDLRAA